MSLTNIILWGVIGAIAGLFISILTRNETTRGYLMDMIAGLIGGIVGGFLLRGLNVIGDAELTSQIHVPSALVAIIGAMVVAGIVEAFRRQNQ